MKKIPLRDGVFTLVDDEDYEALNNYSWCLFSGSGKKEYACRYIKNESGKQIRIWMHRQILPHDLRHTDHIDGDGLNNQKFNLRPATFSQNMANSRLQKNNTSGFKGVFWNKRIERWTAVMRFIGLGKLLYIGSFKDIKDAARAYDEAAIKAWGEFAMTNFPVSKPPTKETTE